MSTFTTHIEYTDDQIDHIYTNGNETLTLALGLVKIDINPNDKRALMQKCNNTLQLLLTICSNYNDNLRKYWPRLSLDEFINYPSLDKVRLKKIKTELLINERNTEQLNSIHNLEAMKNPIQDPRFIPHCLAIQNNVVADTSVDLFGLFKDIQLKSDSEGIIPFTKITLENYEDNYCKLLKQTIAPSDPHNRDIIYEDKHRFVSKRKFKKWYYSQIISLPNTLVKYMDNRNSVTVKLHKDDITITLLFYEDGRIQLLLDEDIPDISPELINDKIDLANIYIKSLDTKLIYSESDLIQLKPYPESFQFMISRLIYKLDDQSYDPKLMETILSNLSTVVRINKVEGNKLSLIYKRVSDYESDDSKLRVISLLHKSDMNKGNKLYEGKAKIIYETKDKNLVIQHFKDDATAFNNLKKAKVEGNGVLNNQISEYILANLAQC